MTAKYRIWLAIAVLGGLWIALFVGDRSLRPQPGLQVAHYRSDQSDPAGLEFGSPPLEQSLAALEERLGAGFEVRYTGWIRIRHAGVYSASIEVDRGSVARLDVGREPFAGTNAGEMYPVQAFRELGVGLHAFELEYRHIETGPPASSEIPAMLNVTWSKGIAISRAIPSDEVFAPSASEWQFQLSAALRSILVLLLVIMAGLILGLLVGPTILRALGLRLATVAVGLLASLLLAEIGLRLFGVQAREYVPGTIWLTYEYPEPNTTTQYVGYLPYFVKEYEVPVHINSRGWRDREFALRKPPGVYRIVVVGDSYVEGKEVLLEHTFHKRLEARLNREFARADRRFEVIALARGGISTEMESRVIRERAARYAPDLVVLAFYPGNDVRENLPSLQQDYNRWANDVYGSKVVPARIDCTDSLTWLNRSRLNNVVTARLCDLYIARLHEFREDLSAEDMTSPDGGVYQDPYDARWNRAWARSGELIGDSKRAAEAMGASFLMLMVHSAQLAGVTGGSLASDAAKFDIDRPFEFLHRICEQQEIDCLDLRPALERFRADTGQPYYWQHDAHWNEHGHRVVADALFERLSPQFSAQ